MGEIQAWPANGNGGGGVLVGGSRSPPLDSHPPNPDPEEIAAEVWREAEEATEQVVRKIQPNPEAGQRRHAVLDYVQHLIWSHLGYEVFSFGSVPLKTYLPDGDIDLTACGLPTSDETLANDVRTVLKFEERNKYSELEVKDVQYIHAEVKLVKCLVQNIVVDISFNQLGGLSTLCFLEQVDRLIGKNNLFKRSIVLIKAWCYYESRILGAHHGLISTYALEVMILYIFHLFHKSLEAPLAVLYKFLDFYSKFDWQNYAISLKGPVTLSCLPELIVEQPVGQGGELLLSEEYLRQSMQSFSTPLRGYASTPRIFQRKHLNIVDPLNQSNNLGRSISVGNFYRIRSAFAFGARRLGNKLLQPVEHVKNEVDAFFRNTLERHGSGQRLDVQDTWPICSVRPSNDCIANGHSQGGLCNQLDGVTISQEDTDVPLHVIENEKTQDSVIELRDCIETSINGDSNATVSSPRPVVDECASSVSSSDPTNCSMGNLTDLTGDLDAHLRNLNRAIALQEQMMMSPYPAQYGPPTHIPPYMNPPADFNGLIHGASFLRPFYVVNHPIAPNLFLPENSSKKPRGTGTFFPNLNSPPYKDRQTHYGRRKNGAYAEPSNDIQDDTTSPANRNHQPLVQLQNSSRYSSRTYYASDAHPRPVAREVLVANGALAQEDSKAPLVNFSDGPLEAANEGHDDKTDSSNLHACSTGPLSTTSSTERYETGSNHSSVPQSFILKDEEDFPPLAK